MFRLFHVCWKQDEVPNDCLKVKPIDCADYKRISFVSIPGKLFVRVLIERFIESTEWQIENEQCGLTVWQFRRCRDQSSVWI